MTESPNTPQDKLLLPPRKAHQEPQRTIPHCSDGAVEQIGVQAMECVLSFLRNKPEEMIQNSAVFIQCLHMLWAECDVAQAEIWAELEARMDLSEKLLKRGIRARKGGRYRSTKLP